MRLEPWRHGVFLASKAVSARASVGRSVWLALRQRGLRSGLAHRRREPPRERESRGVRLCMCIHVVFEGNLRQSQSDPIDSMTRRVARRCRAGTVSHAFYRHYYVYRSARSERSVIATVYRLISSMICQYGVSPFAVWRVRGAPAARARRDLASASQCYERPPAFALRLDHARPRELCAAEMC